MTRRLALALALCCASIAARADELTLEIAQERFREGVALYERGEYEAAIRAFESARSAESLPALDLNIGRCLEKLERYGDAIAAYQRYVRDSNDTDERAAAQREIEILRSKMQTPVQHPALALANELPAREPVPAYKRWWVWATAVGVVMVGVAVGLGVGLSRSDSGPMLKTTLGTFSPF